MDILTTVTEFKHQLKARGYAKATITGYSKNLDMFVKYLTERNITGLKKVSRRIITDYQETIMSEDNAMETKALKIRAV